MIRNIIIIITVIINIITSNCYISDERYYFDSGFKNLSCYCTACIMPASLLSESLFSIGYSSK